MARTSRPSCPRRCRRTAAASTTDRAGVGLVTLGEIIKCDYAKLPNVSRWVASMKLGLKSWVKINEVFYGFAGMVKDQTFEAI